MAVTLGLSVDAAITNAFALMSSIARLDEARKGQAGKSYTEFGSVYEQNIQTTWTILLDISNQLPDIPVDTLQTRIDALFRALQTSMSEVPWSSSFSLETKVAG